ncbi:hypothetical protein [Algicella marina]|uniref:ABC transporter substrate-binding protein n=1 Tax=Algicella marina TaxID=2683284 RepID=A0A6P1STC0_9RHOB|nr:hypothetical protein [Algicella marina]QHQ33924.1 hypothetical protein GO499_01370 [Algicella marina]
MLKLTNTVFFIGVALLPLAATIATATPRPGEPVVVIANPWQDAARAIARTGGTEIPAKGALPFRRAVFSSASLTHVKRAPEIWFLLDSARISTLCGGLA